ncbi:MAG: twin-arginine translocation signal domain-containing protein, partial [Actinomycetota bacterium]|nr:twin-arginine translocation signal domain-containing protein [Actinomycetota bacterium]
MNFSRRHFLAAAGGAVALAACGNSDDSTDTGSTETDGTTGNSTGDTGGAPSDGTSAPNGGWVIVQRFPNHPLFTPGEARLPVSLADDARMLDNGPDELPGWIEDFEGTRVADVVGRKRKDGIPTPYWEVRAELERAVIYTMRFQDDDGYGATFELFDPADVKTPVTGAAMPGFDTPTVDDHRGVDPYCSLTPDPCPLHAVTLTEALASGKPVAYM